MEKRYFDFHVSEYAIARQELIWNFNAANNTLLYSLFANSFVVAWIASEIGKSQKFGAIFSVASLLPVVLSTASWVIYMMRRRTIATIAAYLLNLEERLADPDLGWEKFYLSRRHRFLRSANIFHFMFLLQIALAGYFAFLVESQT